MTLDQDIHLIHVLLAKAIGKRGQDRRDPILTGIGVAMLELLRSDEDHIQNNALSFYNTLRDTGYDHEALAEVDLFKNISPDKYVRYL